MALSASADQARTHSAVRTQPSRPHMHLGARISMEEVAGLPRGPVCSQSALGKLLPRLCFLCSLVTYALLGALLFSLVEGGREVEDPDPDFEEFISKLRGILKCNDTGTGTGKALGSAGLKLAWVPPPFSSALFLGATPTPLS